MTNKPAAVAQPPANETEPQRFARLLAQPQFKPLKSVCENLGADHAALQGAVVTASSYEDFLGRVGYRLVVVKQVHEQDCYARLGRAGGIKAVLPVHDTATYSTMVTLVNFDSTVTTTPKSVEYYKVQFAQFKALVLNRPA